MIFLSFRFDFFPSQNMCVFANYPSICIAFSSARQQTFCWRWTMSKSSIIGQGLRRYLSNSWLDVHPFDAQSLLFSDEVMFPRFNPSVVGVILRASPDFKTADAWESMMTRVPAQVAALIISFLVPNPSSSTWTIVRGANKQLPQMFSFENHGLPEEWRRLFSRVRVQVTSLSVHDPDRRGRLLEHMRDKVVCKGDVADLVVSK
jgi:hypothetical protein